MTDNIPTPTDQQPPVPSPPPADAQDTPPAADSDRQARLKAEAARRRTETRAIEAERDTLATRLETTQRTVIESILANDPDVAYLHRASDLFDIGGVKVADLLDDIGEVDRGKVQAAAETLKSERAYLFGTRPHNGPDLLTQVINSHMDPGKVKGDLGAGWQQALKGGN